MAAFDPGNRLIVALDTPDRAPALELAERVADQVALFKIGLELFVAEGPDLVRAFVARGWRVMLDLKLHDIPATVARATSRAASLGVELLTVHTAGGLDMLRAAVDAAASAGGHTRILGVTVLTSLDGQALVDTGVIQTAAAATEDLERVVDTRSILAARAGCHGVVASAREARHIRAVLRAHAPEHQDDFLIVTPGIRPHAHAHAHAGSGEPGTWAGDQKRVATPAQARVAGADLIVVGRPIRDAADPGRAARDIAGQLAAGGGGSRG